MRSRLNTRNAVGWQCRLLRFDVEVSSNGKASDHFMSEEGLFHPRVFSNDVPFLLWADTLPSISPLE